MAKKGKYGQFIRGVFTAVDFLVLNIIYIIICFSAECDSLFISRQVWLVMNIAFFVVEYMFSNIHNKRVVFADQVMLQSIKSATLYVAVFFGILAFLNLNVSSIVYLRFYILLSLGLSVWWIISRKILKYYRAHGFNFKRIIIIGAGPVGVRLIDELLSDGGYGYKILGVFDSNKKSRTVKGYKGSLEEVEGFVKSNFIDEMYCTLPDDDATVSRMINISDRNAVDFYYIPQFSRTLTRRFELSSIGNVPLLSLRPNPLGKSFNRVTKRFADIMISSIVIILSPIILIPVAIGIKMSSPGPIFFKQKRTGYRGKEFSCYKFRTMKVNGNSDKMQATKNDPRKTKFGDFLRHSSIDELPQFFNVLRGDMSIVGPRPHMIKHTKDYSAIIEKYMLRHTVKPGITGWAQVNGYRGQTLQLWQMEKRVEFDVWYTENWNIFLDFKIIFLTVYNAIKGEKNAF